MIPPIRKDEITGKYIYTVKIVGESLLGVIFNIKFFFLKKLKRFHIIDLFLIILLLRLGILLNL